MKKITKILAALCCMVAFASCDKKNPEDNSLIKPEGPDGGDTELTGSLAGSEYVVITLDEYSTKALGSKVVANYGPDDQTRFLYIWSDTYAAGTCSGLNCYGEAAEWVSLVVTNVGWSGAGWFNSEPTKAIVSNTSELKDWKFHVSCKANAGVAHIIILTWNGATYKFAIGNGQIEDAGVMYNAILPVDGEFNANVWEEYEISLASAGLDFSKDAVSDNMVSVLSGPVAGTTLDIDAVFFYKN